MITRETVDLDTLRINHSHNTPRVFWIGGNSYVIAKSPKGPWLFGNSRVSLVSVNGIGEVRWSVEPRELKWKEDYRQIVEYFGLNIA